MLECKMGSSDDLIAFAISTKKNQPHCILKPQSLNMDINVSEI